MRTSRTADTEMKLSEIDIANITDEIFRQVLFSVPTPEYSYADCIIVFGCHIKPLLDERLRCAVNIYKSKDIGKILITGGVGFFGDFDESAYMKDYLMREGIGEDAILVENKSTTTEQNVAYSLAILGNHGLTEGTRLVLVSHQPHLRRIRLEMEHQLEGLGTKLICEHPAETRIAFENINKNADFRKYVVSEIDKLQLFIKSGTISDEDIFDRANSGFVTSERMEK